MRKCKGNRGQVLKVRKNFARKKGHRINRDQQGGRDPEDKVTSKRVPLLSDL